MIAARISAPRRNRRGTSPDTRNRQNGNTSAGATDNNARHNHGTRHDDSINPP